MSEVDAAAPELLLLEVGNALRRKVSHGDSPVDDVPAALHIVRRQFTLTPDADLAVRATELAMAVDHPVYDCTYVALAERLDAPLVTADRRLVEVGAALGVEVQVLR